MYIYTMTNRNLYGYHQQIEGLNGSIFELFMRGKIADFKKNNGIRINTLLEKMKAIQAEYFIIENDEVKFEMIEGKKKFILLEGKTQDGFDEAVNELMDKPCAITI